jgi:hypothetical protein
VPAAADANVEGAIVLIPRGQESPSKEGVYGSLGDSCAKRLGRDEKRKSCKLDVDRISEVVNDAVERVL